MQVNIGKTIVLDVDTSTLPANVMDHVVYIGLRNILMDSHANVTRESAGDAIVEQSRAMAEKKLAAMQMGEIRANGTRVSSVDPVEARIVKIARADVAAAIKAKGKKVDKEKIGALVTAYIAARHDKLADMAREQLADEATRVADIGLDDLGL